MWDPEAHDQESFLDVAAGVQETKRKLTVLFDVFWSRVLHSLLAYESLFYQTLILHQK